MPVTPALVALLTTIAMADTANTPSPSPTPLSEIARVRATSVCQALNDLVLPVALVVQRNDRDFVDVRKSMGRFAAGSVSSGSPPIAGDAAGAGDLTESGDDASTYTPERTMAASNIDRVTAAILTNLAEADRVMNQSWKAHPANADPAYDALRQRVQNVIDMQRVLAFRLDDVAGTYLSNSGTSMFHRPPEVDAFQSDLDNQMGSELRADVGAEDPLALDPAHLPRGDVAATKHGTAADVANALRIQKFALALESQHLAHTCDGLPPPPASTVAPSPAP